MLPLRSRTPWLFVAAAADALAFGGCTQRADVTPFLENDADLVAPDADGAASPADDTDRADGTTGEDTPDGCNPNACGGCAKLGGTPGAKCGTCASGTYACDGANRIVCNDPVETPPPGTVCGRCKTSKYACAADGASTVCPDDTNGCGGCSPLAHKVGDACGHCGGGKWKCDGTDALRCDNASARNPCGGCSILANPPGAKCGLCGGAVYVCSGDSATVCVDPVRVAPGTACGECGTSKLVCSADGTSTYCPNPKDYNACGGCGALAGAPGTPCLACGVYACSDDKKSVDCVEAAPAVGEKCGLCGTSTYECIAPSKTACAKPDDRRAGVDFSYAPSTPVAQDPRLTSRTSYAFAYTTVHAGVIVDVQLQLSRAKALGTTPGSITVSVYKGRPTSPGAFLGAARVTGDTPSDRATIVTFRLASLDSLPAGTQVYFVVATDSTQYSYALFGGGFASGGAWYTQAWGAGWTSYPTPLTTNVDMNGCF